MHFGRFGQRCLDIRYTLCFIPSQGLLIGHKSKDTVGSVTRYPCT